MWTVRKLGSFRSGVYRDQFCSPGLGFPDMESGPQTPKYWLDRNGQGGRGPKGKPLGQGAECLKGARKEGEERESPLVCRARDSLKAPGCGLSKKAGAPASVGGRQPPRACEEMEARDPHHLLSYLQTSGWTGRPSPRIVGRTICWTCWYFMVPLSRCKTTLGVKFHVRAPRAVCPSPQLSL